MEAYEFVQAQDSETKQFSVSDFELLDTATKRIEFDEMLEDENWRNIIVLLPRNTDLIELTFSFKTKQSLYEEMANNIFSSMAWKE